MNKIDIGIYQGPIELLLYLVQRKEIDIFDIPIAQIANEYLSHIKSISNVDFSTCGDFILMAAILVRMKIQALLPSSRDEAEEEMGPTVTLDQIIEEYQKYKQMVTSFSQMESISSHQFARPGEKLTDEELMDFDSALLAVLLKELKQRRTEKVYVVERTTVSIEYMITKLTETLAQKNSINLIELLVEQESVTKVIGLFIGALELVRLRKAKIVQEAPFGSIYLYSYA